MEIHIDRKWKKETYTIGKMFINGEFFSNTLEDKDRGFSSDTSVDYIKAHKVYGETAIPTGTYEIKLTPSPKFATRVWGKKYQGKVPEIPNVKGFSGVRIHPLNTAADSLGCVGVGKNTKPGMITSSTEYYYQLMDNYILPAIKKGEKITLKITN